jgi:hypothetical protein
MPFGPRTFAVFIDDGRTRTAKEMSSSKTVQWINKLAQKSVRRWAFLGRPPDSDATRETYLDSMTMRIKSCLSRTLVLLIEPKC